MCWAVGVERTARGWRGYWVDKGHVLQEKMLRRERSGRHLGPTCWRRSEVLGKDFWKSFERGHGGHSTVQARGFPPLLTSWHKETMDTVAHLIWRVGAV